MGNYARPHPFGGAWLLLLLLYCCVRSFFDFSANQPHMHHASFIPFIVKGTNLCDRMRRRVNSTARNGHH
uniref:Putative secreted protein n=1 Tax=Anopheles darlingi TaxID=43151 RepID=A0A2M4D7C2_ANODA